MTYYIAEIRLNVKRKTGKTKRETAKKFSKPLLALFFALMLSSALIMVVPATANSEDKIKECLKALSEDVESELPKEAFENARSAEGQRQALANKIAASANQIEAGAYNGAVNKLKNDVNKSVTKWIANQEWETYLLEKVEEIINLIKGLGHSNRLPVALFTESAEAVSTGEPIYFNASGSYDPDGFVVGYYWSFGDGVSDVGVTVNHTYSEVGNYTVTLTVVDNNGATAMSSVTETVVALTSWTAELLATILLIIASVGGFLSYGLYKRRIKAA